MVFPPPRVVVCSGPTQSHAVRIPPNSDLIQALVDVAKHAMKNSHSAQSAFVMTAVGSLSEVTLRMAATDNNNNNKKSSCSNNDDVTTSAPPPLPSSSLAEATYLEIQTFKKHFEIVSLVGTFSADGGKHLHMSVSDAQGQVLGGHLVAGTVFTTLELVLGTISGVSFTREMDAHTGYKELVVKEQPCDDGQDPS